MTAFSADSNRMAMLFARETQYGVPPTTPSMAFMRTTGESLKQDSQTTTSQEIRSDRQTSDVVRVDVSSSGDINWELSSPLNNATPDASLNQFDNMFPAAMMSSGWSSAVTVTASLSVTALDQSLNSSALFGSINAGQWIRLSGMTAPGNNGYFKVVSKSSSSKLILAGAIALVDEASASRVLFMPPQVVNGTTFTSYTIEKRFSDLTNEFGLLTGQAINGMNLNVARQAIITGGFSFLGKKEESQNATLANSTVVATSTDVLQCVDDVSYFAEGIPVLGGPCDFAITGFNFALNNNLRSRTEVSKLGAVSIGVGSVGVTGSLTAYYKNKTVMNKYLAMDASSVAVIVRKAGTNLGWIFELPRIKYTSGQRVAGGINQDIIAQMQFTAYRNPDEDATVRIARLA